MRRSLLALVVTTILFSSCWDWTRKPVPEPSYKKVWGYRPVFTTDTNLLKIQSESPRPIKNPGKIYARGNLIFQNDIGYGIHVIDNSIPSQPNKIGFIKVGGSSEMSLTGNHMYVNSYNTLVVLDVSDWQNIQVVKRISNAFQQGLAGGNYQHYYIPPPVHGVYYDCSMMGYQPGMLQSGWIQDSVLNFCLYK